MPNSATSRRKPVPSAHEKQIRFLTRMAVAICALAALAFFWLFSRANLVSH